MTNTVVLNALGTGGSGNYPPAPVSGSTLIEGTFHVSGVFNGARIVGKCLVGSTLSPGLKFEHSDQAPKYVKVNCDQLQFIIEGGNADTSLTLTLSSAS